MIRSINKFLFLLSIVCIGFAQGHANQPNFRMKSPLGHEKSQSSSSSSSSSSSKSIHPKKFRLPKVCNIATKPVGPKGAMVFNKRDGFIYYSDGTEWIQIENAEPAPAVITVDPSFTCPNNVTEFTTIQDAINSLGEQKIVDTTINIAQGTYNENLLFQSILNSDATKLKIIGDTRPIVGEAYVHDSFWNLVAAPNTTVGGGNGSKAVFSTPAANQLKVTNATVVGGNLSPTFNGVGGVIPGDTVLIRDTTGAITQYSVSAVGADTLTFTTPITGTVNALGAAMTVLPNRIIAPAAGVPLDTSTLETFTGLYFKVPTAVATNGIEVRPYAFARFTNCVLFNDSTGTGINQDATSNVNLGVTSFGNTIFTRGTTLASNIYSRNAATNSLLARSVAGMGIFPNGSSITLTGSKIIGSGSATFALFFLAGGTRLETLGATDIICGANIAITLAQRSNLILGLNGHLIIRGAPTVGIDVSSSFIEGPTPTRLSISSTDPNFVGLRVGFGSAGGDSVGETSLAAINFGNITLPNSATTYIAQVLNGSQLNVGGVGIGGGVISMGINANGFLATNNATLTFNGAGATGSITGNAASTTSILFDIRNGSSLVIPANTTRNFTNFSKTFNFDNASRGVLFNVTSVTTTGGVNLKADNMSRIELDTVSFNGGVGGIGIQTSNGAFVGKQGGATVTIVPPTIAISPAAAAQLTTDTIGNYNSSSYATGTVVISP